MPSILGLTTKNRSTARGASSPVKPAEHIIVLLVQTDLPAGLPTTKGNPERGVKPAIQALHMPLPGPTMSAPLSFWSIPALMPSNPGLTTTEGNTARKGTSPGKPAQSVPLPLSTTSAATKRARGGSRQPPLPPLLPLPRRTPVQEDVGDPLHLLSDAPAALPLRELSSSCSSSPPPLLLLLSFLSSMARRTRKARQDASTPSPPPPRTASASDGTPKRGHRGAPSPPTSNFGSFKAAGRDPALAVVFARRPESISPRRRRSLRRRELRRRVQRGLHGSPWRPLEVHKRQHACGYA